MPCALSAVFAPTSLYGMSSSSWIPFPEARSFQGTRSSATCIVWGVDVTVSLNLSTLVRLALAALTHVLSDSALSSHGTILPKSGEIYLEALAPTLKIWIFARIFRLLLLRLQLWGADSVPYLVDLLFNSFTIRVSRRGSRTYINTSLVPPEFPFLALPIRRRTFCPKFLQAQSSRLHFPGSFARLRGLLTLEELFRWPGRADRRRRRPKAPHDPAHPIGHTVIWARV